MLLTKNHGNYFLLVLFYLLIWCSPTFGQLDKSKFDKVVEVIDSPLPTTGMKVDSIRKFTDQDIQNYTDEEKDYFVEIMTNAASNSLSLQSEYHWNAILARFRNKTNEIGEAVILNSKRTKRYGQTSQSLTGHKL